MADVKFRFEEIATFKTEVTVTLPGGDQQTFVGEFLYLDDEANDEAVKLTNPDLMRQVWKGWDGIVGADDKPLPFSEPQLELFLKHSYIHNAGVTAYVRGRQGLRAKN
jgi:hypothetical protein